MKEIEINFEDFTEFLKGLKKDLIKKPSFEEFLKDLSSLTEMINKATEIKKEIIEEERNGRGETEEQEVDRIVEDFEKFVEGLTNEEMMNNCSQSTKKQSQYIIKVEGMSSANKIHNSLFEAEKEAIRLTKKENRNVTLYEAISKFSPGEVFKEIL